MIELENYYKGETEWREYVKLFNEILYENSFQKELFLKLDSRIDFTKVIYHHFGNESIKWIESKNPSLDNLTPIECFSSERYIMRLKVCLLRIH